MRGQVPAITLIGTSHAEELSPTREKKRLRGHIGGVAVCSQSPGTYTRILVMPWTCTLEIRDGRRGYLNHGSWTLLGWISSYTKSPLDVGR